MLAATPNAKIVCSVEHYRADDQTNLDTSLAYTVENLGDVDVELAFNGGSLTIPVYAGMNREFEFLGVRYSGDLQLTFDANTTGTNPKVAVLKRTLVCPQ